MINYLFESTFCLSIFMLFYSLFLENENVHHLKRWYLLGTLCCSALFPLISFTVYEEVTIPVVLDVFPVAELDEFPNVESAHLLIGDYIIYAIYGLGVLIFGLKFLLSLVRLYHKIDKNEIVSTHDFQIVLLKNKVAPHSFFNYVFLDKSSYQNDEIPKEVLVHEQTHIVQKHSIDVLLLEVLLVICWFNPLLYILKRMVKLNHEFLADQAVLISGTSRADYLKTLFLFSTQHSTINFESSLDYSFIKKRFRIMKKRNNQRRKAIRIVLILPLLLVLLLSFSKRDVVMITQSSDVVQYKITDSIGQEGIVSEGLMNEYKSFIIEHKRTHGIDYTKYFRVRAIYALMSPKQKLNVEKLPKTPILNLQNTRGKQPTLQQIESWKDKEKYAIWIDGKNVDNTILNKYSPFDIAYFTGSKVYQNARTRRFPQPYQFSLFTKQGFEKNYEMSTVNSYRKMKKRLITEIQKQEHSSKKEHAEIEILKQQTLFYYNQISKKHIEKYNVQKIGV